jgi:ribonuclease R
MKSLHRLNNSKHKLMGKKKTKKEVERFILEFLHKHGDMFIPVDAISAALNMQKGSQQKLLHKAIKSLTDRNLLSSRGRGSEVRLEQSPGKLAIAEGPVSFNRFGVAFVKIADGTTEVRIPRKKTGLALPGDIVQVRVSGSGRNGQPEGKITGIVDRSNRIYVGTFRKEGKNQLYIEPDEKSAHISFFVLPENSKNASDNVKVIFELVDWLHPKSLPEARITEILGPSGSNDAAVLSVLAENQLRSTFPEEVDRYAERVATVIPESEYKRRLDLRTETVFTIDPEDAKDFDDALSISVLENGNYYLGVHIADVTHYVQPDSILDREAYNRGTSVYLVDRVIPMLPERLSNGVCSLRPNEEKLTYSCFMEVTPKGRVVKHSIEETVIKSAYRLTYEQAQEIIDGQKHDLSQPMAVLSEMTRMLTVKRFREGSVDLNTPEPRFELDAAGKPLGVYVKKRLLAHRLVEECMLLANKTVALHVDHLRKASGKKAAKDLYPFFYRIHDKPDAEKLSNVAENVKPLGIKFDVRTDNVTSAQINELLDQIKGKPLEYAINELILRSMAKAVYSPKNIGHYGLGFGHYAHFTSPIRRYPDVVVHRLLKNYASGLPGYSFEELGRFGTDCSEREKMAATAERDSVKLKQIEFMSERIGQEFNGVISGVIDRGLFVTINDYYCEGMVHISDLKDDYYVYDQFRHSLTGRYSGKTFMLGGEIRVKVMNASIEQRQIDFELA